jgi:acyl carrier protein
LESILFLLFANTLNNRGEKEKEPTMTREEIGQAVVDIIEDVLPDDDCSSIDPDVALRDQLDLDSMDFLDIVMELRKQYGVEVPEEEYPKLATLNSCIDYLEPKLKDK